MTQRNSGWLTNKWTYDPLGRVVESHLSNWGSERQSESMLYYESNEVKEHQVNRYALGDRTFNYRYDAQHQLERAWDSVSEYNASFTYHNAGRVKTAEVDSVIGAPQVLGRDVTYNYGDHGDVDAHAVQSLDNAKGSAYATYLHDLSGNVTSRAESGGSTTTFVYDGDDLQREAKTGNQRELYYYDENGQRFLSVKRSSGGYIFGNKFWFEGTEIWRNGSSGTLDKVITRASLGGTPMARIEKDGSAYSYEYTFHNGLGHLTGAFTHYGASNAEFVYGPFGEILAESGSANEHLRRFNGKEADQLSRLNYYGYRYYDPLSLTWTQADPLYRVAPDLAYDEPRRMSLYAFSLNNPVRYADPDGRNPALVQGGRYAVVAAAAAAVAGYKGLKKGLENFFDSDSPASDAVSTAEILPRLKESSRSLQSSLGVRNGKVSDLAKEVSAAYKALQASNAEASDADEAVNEVGGQGNVGAVPKPPRGKGSVPSSERDSRRRFTSKQQREKAAEQGNKCGAGCGKDIDETNSDGHHETRHADGGETVPENQVQVCPECHKEIHAK